MAVRPNPNTQPVSMQKFPFFGSLKTFSSSYVFHALVFVQHAIGDGVCPLIPTLTLGIPGESVTAVLMGGLIIQGLNPGPQLFNEENALMTYTFFAGFVFVQFFMLGIGLIGCRGFAQISRLSDAILIPVVTVLCFVGSYSIHKNIMDIIVMLTFGMIGYLMRRFDLNTAAVVLALILGPIGEKGLRNALRISKGDPKILFTGPICWVLICMCILGVLSPIFMNRLEKKAEEQAKLDISPDSEIE